MKKWRIILLIAFLFTVGNILLAQSLWGDKNESMYTKSNNFKIGDIIIVNVTESNTAQQQAKTTTTTSEQGSAEVGPGSSTGGFLPLFTAITANTKSSNKYSGDGTTQRTGKLKTTISVRIKKILDDGNLLIAGEKTININGEKEIIKLSGIIRPNDVNSNNTIKSTYIAEAKLEYVGKGNIDAARKPGIITKFLNWLF